jgi:Gly-Xaa carboxypeptidase
MLHSKIESSAELLPTSQPPPQRNRLPKYLLALLALAAIPQLIHHCCPSLPSRQRDDSPLCPQTTALVPRDNAALYRDLNDLYSTPEFKENAIDWLAGAVRIP